MKTLKNRRIAKVLWPAFLLTAALALPPAGQADPSPKGKAHAAEARKDKDNKKNKVVKVQKVQKVKVKQVNVGRSNAQWKQQQRIVEQRQAQQRIVAQQQRVAAQQRLQAQQRLAAQRRLALQRPVYVAPVARQPVRRYRWDGWNNRYGRRASGVFQLEGTFVDRQYGCAIVQDRQGQVIPLVGFNPLVPRRGEHFLLTGRVESGTSCGTAFRVSSVDRVWADSSRRRVIFDRRYDGDYAYDRSRDRNRYDDRYDDDYYYDRRGDDNRRLISVDGRLDRDRCPSIRTDDGEVFGLTGDLRDYRDGEWVRVVGFLEGRSRCGGQGIEIGEITGS